VRIRKDHATRGFLARLDVRLVLALSSLVLIALIVSGVTLSRILPGYLEEQASQQLQAAARGTGILVRLRAESASVQDLGNRERREAILLAGAAQDATVAFGVGAVQIVNALDGSQAASARLPNENAVALTNQGLRPDTEIAAYTLPPRQLSIALPGAEPGLTQRDQNGVNVLPLRVVVSQPYTTQELTVERLTVALLVLGITALAVSALLGVIIARWLTGPMHRLGRVSARLSQGELDQRVPPSGILEFDQLASQFNQMADRVSQSLRMLEADRDRLREFVADVSHELRTPIAALRAFNELQREGALDEPTRREFLDRSSEQLRRLEWLSTNLLDLSRIDAGIFPLDVREGDLREPIRSVVEAHAEVAEERGVALMAGVPAEPVTLRFDRERMVQLVNNLVGNALKFTPRGGQVGVDLRVSSEGAEIEVRDTGPGIPEAELPRIFERFYRGTNVGEARASGSGLGLAIARSIVEMHGGRIDVASAIGEGTSFTVHLPRQTVPVPPAEVTRASRRGIRALGSRVRRISTSAERGGGGE
jgi:signal transduction histidine kinase